jgi:predicted dinucleotide-binding enzyme
VRIGVIGAGQLGGALGRQLAVLGHKVLIANSRGPESLTGLAAEIGATPASVFEATKAAASVGSAAPARSSRNLVTFQSLSIVTVAESGRRTSRAVRVGDDLQEMPVGVVEVKSASAVIVVVSPLLLRPGSAQ